MSAHRVDNKFDEHHQQHHHEIGYHDPDARYGGKIVGNARSGGADQHGDDNPGPFIPLFVDQPHTVALMGYDMLQHRQHSIDRKAKQHHAEQRPADTHHLPLTEPADTNLRLAKVDIGEARQIA